MGALMERARSLSTADAPSLLPDLAMREAYENASGQGAQGISKRTLSKPSGGRQDRFSGELREAIRASGGHTSPELRERLVEAKIWPINGAATGMDGAAFMHNLPPEGTYMMDSDVFFAQTERNDVPQGKIAFPGFSGTPLAFRISNVGVYSGLQIVFEGTLKTLKGTGTVTSTYQWPWNVLKRFTLNANGQTSLLSCEGLDLRARNQRVYRNPRDPITKAINTDGVFGDPETGTIADGEYAIYLVWDVPIVHDWYTITGSLFSQSDQIYLGWNFQPPAIADLFTLTGTATATLTGTISSTATFFDVPYADTAQGRKVLIPNLEWLHGYVGTDLPYANTGDVKAPFIRTSGELLAYYAYMDNGGAATIDPAALEEIRFEYGGNRKPRVYNPTEVLLTKNLRDYNGRILPKAGYYVLDFEADNPARDLVFPKGVTELQTVMNIATGTTINPNAHIHFVEEALFAGR